MAALIAGLPLFRRRLITRATGVMPRLAASIWDMETFIDAGEGEEAENENLEDEAEDVEGGLAVIPGGVRDGPGRFPSGAGLEPGDGDANARRERVDDDLCPHAAVAEQFRIGRFR